MKKRKYMEITTPSTDHYEMWERHCVFSVQKNPATDDRCMACPFKESFSAQALPKCKERNVRFLLVKRWVGTVVSVSTWTTLNIWADNLLTVEKLDELMWKGEFKFVRHGYETWHFYRLHKLSKLMKGVKRDFWK